MRKKEELLALIIMLLPPLICIFHTSASKVWTKQMQLGTLEAEAFTYERTKWKSMKKFQLQYQFHLSVIQKLGLYLECLQNNQVNHHHPWVFSLGFSPEKWTNLSEECIHCSSYLDVFTPGDKVILICQFHQNLLIKNQDLYKINVRRKLPFFPYFSRGNSVFTCIRNARRGSSWSVHIIEGCILLLREHEFENWDASLFDVSCGGSLNGRKVMSVITVR